MADSLNTRAISVPIFVEADKEKLERTRSILGKAYSEFNALKASTPLKGASEEEKDAYRQKTSKAKAELVALRKEFNELTTAQDKYESARTASGLKEDAYARQAAGVRRMADSMRNLSNATEGFRQSWSNAITLLRNSAVHMTAFVAGQVAFVGSIAKAGEAIHNTAGNIGIGLMEYQDLAYAANRAGVSNSQFDSLLRKLNHTIGEAGAGSASATAAFARLGLSHQALMAMPTEARMPMIAESMKGTSSETERAYLAQTLFGRGGEQMAQILKDGAAGLKEQMKYGHDHSYPMTEKEIKLTPSCSTEGWLFSVFCES
jgi:hypothetical protein